MQPASDLQYPIGKYVEQPGLSTDERMLALSNLEKFPRQLSAVLTGLSEAQLDTPYRPGSWTIRVLVHHIADCHLIAYSWTRLALTEDRPTVFGYDPEAFAELADAALPPDCSLQVIERVHQRWVAILKAMHEPDWKDRGYVHPESGYCALETMLAMYDWHSRHHLAHIVHCRERHGW